MLKNKDYLEMLKEAVANNDTYDDVQPTGKYEREMLDPILSYKGDGKLETNRELGNIIEQFYFGEDEDVADVEEETETPEEEEETETPEEEEAELPEEEEEEVEESFNIYNDRVLKKLISEMEITLKGPLNKPEDEEEEEEEEVSEGDETTEEEAELPEEEEEPPEEEEEETPEEEEEEENVQEMISFFEKELL